MEKAETKARAGKSKTKWFWEHSRYSNTMCMCFANVRGAQSGVERNVDGRGIMQL